MIRTTVSRDDTVYECFPDVARARDGSLVCVFRQCMSHAPFPFSRLVARRSLDDGANWTERQVIAECAVSSRDVERHATWIEPDAMRGYQEARARISDPWYLGARINCARLLLLADGTLLLIADFYKCPEGGAGRWENRIWRSSDCGLSWQGPEVVSCAEGIVPSLVQLRSGDIILGLLSVDPGKERSFIVRSADGGRTWSAPLYLPVGPTCEMDEVNYVELDDGTIVGFGRNQKAEREQRPSGGLKVLSADGGATWEGPFETWLMGLTGRPRVGLIRGGEVCIAYRCCMPNEMLAMHVMTQEAARNRGFGGLIERQPVPQDIPGRIARERGDARPWYMTSYYPGRTFVIDVDRSVHRDCGYPGWVLLDGGDLFVVDYINDDAPLAHIRGYRITRSDYVLFPEGDLPWLHPSGQPFRGITLGMAEEQVKRNRKPGR